MSSAVVFNEAMKFFSTGNYEESYRKTQEAMKFLSVESNEAIDRGNFLRKLRVVSAYLVTLKLLLLSKKLFSEIENDDSHRFRAVWAVSMATRLSLAHQRHQLAVLHLAVKLNRSANNFSFLSHLLKRLIHLGHRHPSHAQLMEECQANNFTDRLFFHTPSSTFCCQSFIEISSSSFSACPSCQAMFIRKAISHNCPICHLDQIIPNEELNEEESSSSEEEEEEEEEGESEEETLAREEEEEVEEERKSFSSSSPIIICINELRRLNALHEPGIFRESASSSSLKRLVSALIDNQSAEQFYSALEKCTVHDLAGLLKHSLRNRSEPLVPATNQWAEIEEASDVFRLSSDWSESQHTEALALFDFLREIAAHSKVNNMTIMNLAVCISPSLFQAGTRFLDATNILIEYYGTEAAASAEDEKKAVPVSSLTTAPPPKLPPKKKKGGKKKAPLSPPSLVAPPSSNHSSSSTTVSSNSSASQETHIVLEPLKDSINLGSIQIFRVQIHQADVFNFAGLCYIDESNNDPIQPAACQMRRANNSMEENDAGVLIATAEALFTPKKEGRLALCVGKGDLLKGYQLSVVKEFTIIKE